MPSVGEIARAIGVKVIGDERTAISGAASVESAVDGDLVFVEDEKRLASALNSAAGAVIAGTFAQGVVNSKTLIIAANPRLAFARAVSIFPTLSQTPRQQWGIHSLQKQEPGIHRTAVVASTATIAESVTVDPCAFIDDHSSVGDRTWIGAGCVGIGQDCKIYPGVTIYPGTRIGDRVIVHAGAVLGSDGFGYVLDPESGRYEKFPQIGTLEIEDDVEIGANTTIDRGALEVTRIGRGAKIDNLVHIGHNCNVGENVIIAAQAGFSGSIVVEDNVVIGGQVGVGERARIEEGVMLGGQAGVLPKKVLRGKGVAFWGTPAKPLREYLKSLAALARLGKRE
jgi:UDP-3-O-[3-hydroxymyristoyl] glucosamine N-acyltransferase